jgi:hypothetical protein
MPSYTCLVYCEADNNYQRRKGWLVNELKKF